jgi:hypothetical protein
VGTEWVPRERWMVYADYDIDIGFGASPTSWPAPDGCLTSRWLGIAASRLQHIYEFRSEPAE